MIMQSTIIPSPPGHRLNVPRWSRVITAVSSLLVGALAPTQLGAQIVAWDFTGESTVATSTAEVKDTNLDIGSGLLTRGTTATASSGNNSFRTQGFQNNGISVANTDYFQTTIQAAPGYVVSLSSIDARFAGTASFAASPGVSSQFAYSLDGTNFTLIGTPTVTVGSTTPLPQISVSAIPALQNVPSGTTVTLRYYASGQTTGGGWGFFSSAAGVYGFALGGSVFDPSAPNIFPSSAFTAFESFSGTVSDSQSFTVTSLNLTSDITLTAPTGFEVSSDNVIFAPTAALPPAGGTGYVRITSTATPGAVSGNLTLTSTGAPDRTIALTGNVVNVNLFTLIFDPTTLPEDSAGPFVGTVSIPRIRASEVVVTLASANLAAVTVPASATIPAGSLTATFDATPVAAPASFVTNTSLITASASGFSSGSATLSVTNVDVTPITRILLGESPYSQDFDSLGTTAFLGAVSATTGVQTSLGAIAGTNLNGWFVGKIAGNETEPTTSISPDFGERFNGLVYNYGAVDAADRALGIVASASNTMAMGALITNNTSETLTALRISLTAEFWRSSTSVQNVLTFGYGVIDGASVTESNFLSVLEGVTAATDLDITGPPPVTTNGPLDGNAAINQATFTDIAIPISLAPNQTAFIRWQDVNDGGNDAGLALDNLTITGDDNPLFIPQFDIVAGSYLTDQTVKVANFGAYPSGTEIRYTLDGSTPTAASTLYNDTTGILVAIGSGSVTLRAIAVQTTPSLPSLVGSTTYRMPLDVANLTGLRAATVDSTIYRVVSPVTYTAGTSFRNTKFFQDSGAGIQIDDLNGIVQSYALGDNVAGIIGRLTLFQGQLQFLPQLDFGTPVSSGNAVTPLARTILELTDADQSMLVTLSGVTFASAGGNFGGGGTTTVINDGTAGVFRNVFGDSDITGNVIPAGPVTVTGIIQKANVSSVPTLTIGARGMSDLIIPFSSWTTLYAPGQPASADHDNDGVSNGLEYFMGAVGSTFTANPALVGGKISWPKNPSFKGSYTVQTSPNLVNWTDVSSTVVGGKVEFNFPPPGSGTVFARIQVTPAP